MVGFGILVLEFVGELVVDKGLVIRYCSCYWLNNFLAVGKIEIFRVIVVCCVCRVGRVGGLDYRRSYGVFFFWRFKF